MTVASAPTRTSVINAIAELSILPRLTLHSNQLTKREHDLHFLAIRNIRCCCFWSILPPSTQSASGAVAGCREPVLLQLWPAVTSATFGSCSVRDLSVPDPGAAESFDLAAYGHCLQSGSACLLQI